MEERFGLKLSESLRNRTFELRPHMMSGTDLIAVIRSNFSLESNIYLAFESLMEHKCSTMEKLLSSRVCKDACKNIQYRNIQRLEVNQFAAVWSEKASIELESPQLGPQFTKRYGATATPYGLTATEHKRVQGMPANALVVVELAVSPCLFEKILFLDDDQSNKKEADDLEVPTEALEPTVSGNDIFDLRAMSNLLGKLVQLELRLNWIYAYYFSEEIISGNDSGLNGLCCLLADELC